MKVHVGDLLGSPGKERPFEEELPVSLQIGEVTVDGPMRVGGVMIGLLDAVKADFEVGAEAHFTCTRCLVEWDEGVETVSERYFRTTADEDGYGIVDGEIDMYGPARDELALSLPAAPVCKPDCLGLCPTCGTDLNTDPCDGHGDESQSPFAVLKDLFES
ncbi:MAG: DUF177 domain-containing protein [Acidimicrobiia bacterium]